MPSAPCLSSRIETSLRIDPAALVAVDRVETLLRDELKPDTVRCRVRSGGVVVELDEPTLAQLLPAQRYALEERIRSAFGEARPVQFQAYVRGSAFLRERGA